METEDDGRVRKERSKGGDERLLGSLLQGPRALSSCIATSHRARLCLPLLTDVQELNVLPLPRKGNDPRGSAFAAGASGRGAGALHVGRQAAVEVFPPVLEDGRPEGRAVSAGLSGPDVREADPVLEHHPVVIFGAPDRRRTAAGAAGGGGGGGAQQ